MQVRASRAGYYGGEFKPAGAVFRVKPGQTASWFAPLAGQSGPLAPDIDAADLGKPEPGKPKRGRPAAGSRPKSLSGPAEPAVPDSL